MKSKLSFLIGLIGVAIFSVQIFSFATKDEPVQDFIAEFSEGERSKFMYSFDDIYRERWHYLPATSWTRPGIGLIDMTEAQKTKAFLMLRAYLSESGYEKTLATIDLELVLAELENNPVRRDPEKYYISIYGNPGEDHMWSWRFEGHHVALHFTTVDGELSLSPRFFGANPGIVKSGSKKGLESLKIEENLGLELVNSLSKAQKKDAIIRETAFWEIVTSNSVEVSPLAEVGIRMKDLDLAQQEVMVQLIEEYISSIPENLANARMKSIKEENFENILFGWAGATELGEEHYYRIQGESFLIEFDNAQNDGNHIHTVWRDFDGDFGRDLIREHRENHQH